MLAGGDWAGGGVGTGVETGVFTSDTCSEKKIGKNHRSLTPPDVTTTGRKIIIYIVVKRNPGCH